jgi:hypothetical protein
MKDIGAFCSVSLDFLGIYYIEKEKKVPINPRDLTPGCSPVFSSAAIHAETAVF